MFFPVGASRQQQPPRRRRFVWVFAGIALIYGVFTALSRVWTDYQWFRSVDQTGVWLTRWVWLALLGLLGAVVVFLVIWGNMRLARYLSVRYASFSTAPEDPSVAQIRQAVGERSRTLEWVAALGAAALLGLGVSAWRDQALLFLNSQPFGVTDPQFGLDLSFFMFRLPLWSTIVSWLTGVAVATLVTVGVSYFALGGIRFPVRRMPRFDTQAKAHLSALAAVIALLRALSYRIDTYELLLANNQNVFGAGYADINARLPALNLLIAVSIFSAILFIINIWRRGWVLVAVSVAAWLFVSLAAGVAYPAIVQRFQVQPNELVREGPYIERNIEATRSAYGLDEVEVRSFDASFDLEASDIARNAPTIDNVRLWDPDVLNRTYQQLQEIRTYYRVDHVDTDRYPIGGTDTQVMLALREMDEPNIPAQDWQNQRLVYTHGFGAVLSPANVVAVDGQPDFLLRDIPPETTESLVELTQPRIYFGETYERDRPVIVRSGTAPQEIDYPATEEGGGGAADNRTNNYDGEAGVEISGILNRLAFALRYGDLNILISSQINPDSRVLMQRNVQSRVEAVAPFLVADADPYPVILEGRIIWVVDMYAISGDYPYSQPIGVGLRGFDTARLSSSSQLPLSGFNYIRNSVKATVDAFDGTITLYVVDESDPLVAAWGRVFPDLFTDAGQIPPGLNEHFRYPQDLFKIQSELYLDYHMVDVTQFFQRNDAWSIPSDPSTIRRIDLLRGDQIVGVEGAFLDYLEEMLPYYLLMTLPGEDDTSYVLLQPYNPLEKPNMSAFLIADSSPERYGRLIDYRMPQGSLVEGTGQVGNRIDQDDEISQQFTLWRGQGSSVVLGDMLVVPVDESVLYVQPVYLEAEQGGLPEFRRVVVVHGDDIEWDDTLDGALAKIFGTDDSPAPPPEEDDQGAASPTGEEQAPLPSTVQELLSDASDAFDQANEALRSGNLAEYQRLVDRAAQLIQQALDTSG
ncbi:MAG: UPF0182 family protein [bacterium]|nr:UPF0182 family protein [Acidimicrobiia bacterium]MCY4649598.1 UPF0182 family protein [bacterium]